MNITLQCVGSKIYIHCRHDYGNMEKNVSNFFLDKSKLNKLKLSIAKENI